MNLWSVDRIVGDVAVLIDENGNSRDVIISELPPSIKEGTMLRSADGGYAVDEATATVRKNAVLSLQEKLRRKGK